MTFFNLGKVGRRILGDGRPPKCLVVGPTPACSPERLTTHAASPHRSRTRNQLVASSALVRSKASFPLFVIFLSCYRRISCPRTLGGPKQGGWLVFFNGG